MKNIINTFYLEDDNKGVNYISFKIASMIQDDARTPVIELNSLSSSGCNRYTDLKLTKITFGNSIYVGLVDPILIEPENNQILCPQGAMQDSTKLELDTDWLKKYSRIDSISPMKLIFYMNGSVNKYNINYKEYELTITPVKTVNVISKLPENYKNANEADVLTKIIYPIDVAVLNLTGKFSVPNKDYTSELASFARTQGLKSIDEVYPEIPQTNDPKRLYVVVPNEEIFKEDRSINLGTLPGEAVQVNLVQFR